MRRVDELNDRLGGAHSTLRDTINHLDEILSKNLEDPSEEITHALEPNMVEINDLAREVLIGRQEFSDSEKTVLGITSTIYFASLFMYCEKHPQVGAVYETLTEQGNYENITEMYGILQNTDSLIKGLNKLPE